MNNWHYIIYILIDNWHRMNTSNVWVWWIWNDNKSSMIKKDLKLQFMKRHFCFQISFPKLWKWLSWKNRLENDNTMMKSQLHKKNMDNKDERFIYKFQKTYGTWMLKFTSWGVKITRRWRRHACVYHLLPLCWLRWWHMKLLHRACV